MRLASWGNYPVIETVMRRPAMESEAVDFLDSAASAIGHGLGRSYGDSALNTDLTLDTGRLNAMLSFNEDSGELAAEAGVSLAEIINTFGPRGWFPAVTPGTKFVTLGGAIASDVHGKNHHQASSFAAQVSWIDVLTSSRGVVRCSADEHPDLFHATCGGHGLTGLILRVAVKLRKIPSAYIAQTMIKARDISHIMEVFNEQYHMPFSVAWIDCLKSGPGLGRSIFMGGDFATLDDLGAQRNKPFRVRGNLPLAVPFNFPSFALNSFSIKAFNALYYAKAPQNGRRSIISYNTFFYPLDAIHDWNRIYGKRGFTQYQFVIPLESAAKGLPAILKKIAGMGMGSFLAVLKLFGDQPSWPGNISFPDKGYTLALDFPISPRLFGLLDELDAMVLDYGGRHYLTKDCRLSAPVFKKSYGAALDEFMDVKSRWDPSGRFRSRQSDRLGLTGPQAE